MRLPKLTAREREAALRGFIKTLGGTLEGEIPCGRCGATDTWVPRGYMRGFYCTHCDEEELLYEFRDYPVQMAGYAPLSARKEGEARGGKR
jgi:hypothetical protein